MRRMCFLGAVALCLVHAPSATAQHEVLGIGGNTCAQFASDYLEAPDAWELLYYSWAGGFLTGLDLGVAAATGSSNSSQLASISLDDQLQYLRRYCAENPDAIYRDAVYSLYLTAEPTPFNQ